MKSKAHITAISILSLCLGQLSSHAYTHPCIPSTVDELATIKDNLDKEPWKQGYAALAATSTA